MPRRQARRASAALMRMRETGLILVILVLFIVMSFASPYFLTWENMRAMAMAFAVEGIVVVGMTILLISGGIDLSVGSVDALAMVIAGLLFLEGMDPWLASAIAILACAGIGAAMGFFVTRVGLHHFIVSLAFMVIARGAVPARSPAAGPLGLYTLPPEFKFIGQGSIGVIPVVIVIFVVVVVAVRLHAAPHDRVPQGLLHRQQREGGRLFRHPHQAVIFLTTMLCSTLCGVAGIIYMARFGSAQPTFGIGMELNVIAAAVIGGASLSGGSGTIFGAILGAILLSVVSSSLALLDVSVYWQDIIRGSILLAAVAVRPLPSTSDGRCEAADDRSRNDFHRYEAIRQIYTVLVLHFVDGITQAEIASCAQAVDVQGQPPDQAGPRARHGEDRHREPVPARWSTSRSSLIEVAQLASAIVRRPSPAVPTPPCSRSGAPPPTSCSKPCATATSICDHRRQGGQRRGREPAARSAPSMSGRAADRRRAGQALYRRQPSGDAAGRQARRHQPCCCMRRCLPRAASSATC